MSAAAWWSTAPYRTLGDRRNGLRNRGRQCTNLLAGRVAKKVLIASQDLGTGRELADLEYISRS